MEIKLKIEFQKNRKKRSENLERPFRFLPDLPDLTTHWTGKTVPEICIIHTTAGHQKQSAHDFFSDFIDRRLCTDFIDVKGEVYSQREMNKWGSHVGKAKWNGVKLTSKSCLGVELACAGKLELRNGKWFTWFNKEIPEDQVRYVTKEQGYNSEGGFQKLTEAQEYGLMKYIHVLQFFGVKQFLFHSDVSGYRGKTDVDGSLSLPLRKFMERMELRPLDIH